MNDIGCYFKKYKKSDKSKSYFTRFVKILFFVYTYITKKMTFFKNIFYWYIKIDIYIQFKNQLCLLEQKLFEFIFYRRAQ